MVGRGDLGDPSRLHLRSVGARWACVPAGERVSVGLVSCHHELTTRQLLISNPLRLGRPLRLCDKIEAISLTYRSNPAIFMAVI